jgi:hypothetical protein
MAQPDGRPFADLRESGLLWLINTSVFHSRGYALALQFDAEGNATGWRLQGDGSEPWTFLVDDPLLDLRFEAVNRLLAPRDDGATASNAPMED